MKFSISISRIGYITFLICFLTISVETLKAARRYAVANANWNVNSTWAATSGGSGGATYPVAGDTVYIGEGATDRTVTIPAGFAAACKDLRMGTLSDNTKGVLSFGSSSSSLNISGDVLMNRPNGAATTSINVDAGSFTVSGSVTLAYHTSSSTDNGRINEIRISTGTVTIAGTLGLNAEDSGGKQAQILFTGAGRMNIAGSFLLNPYGLLTGSTGTVNFNGTNVQTIPVPAVSNYYYYNLVSNNVSSKGATIDGVVTSSHLKGSLNVQSGKFSNGGYSITGSSGQTLTVANGATLQLTGTSSTFPAGFSTITLGSASTVEYAGSADQTIYNAASPGYGNLTLSGIATKSAPSGLYIRGSVHITSTFSAGSYSHYIGGNWNNEGTFSAGSSTVFFNGSAAQTINNGGGTFNNFEILNTAGVCSAVTNGITVSGSFTTTTGTTLDMGSHALSVNTVSHAGTLRTQYTGSLPITSGKTWGGTVNFNATSGGQTVVGGTYTNLMLGNSSGSSSAATNLTVNGTLTTTAGGTLDLKTFTLGGTLSAISNNGTIQTENTGSTPIPSGRTWGGTISYSSPSGAQNVVAGTYLNLKLGHTGGTTTAASALTVNGSLTTASGGTFDMGTYSLGGTFTATGNAGVIKTANSSSAPFPDDKTWGGTVEYHGTTQTVVRGTYHNLKVSTSGAKTLSGSATVGGNLDIVTGPLTIGTAGTLTVSGTTSLSGTECLVIKSGATGTGSLIDNGFSGTGSLRIERHLTPYSLISDRKYHFLSSPVTAQPIRPEFVSNTNPIPGNDDFYKFDETTYHWINTRNNSGNWNSSFENDFVIGRGYLIAYASEYTKVFSGTPNTYPGTGLTLTCTWTSFSGSGGSEGWNLLGNPFPSAIDWAKTSKGSGMDNALYYYDSELQNYRYYIALAGVPVGLGSGQPYIPAMQGFMVHAKQTGTRTITLNNTMRTHSGQNVYYKEDAPVANLLNLTVRGNSFEDQAWICFLDGSTESFDGEFDAYKLRSFNDRVPQLYTVTPDNTDLAINVMPSPVEGFTGVPLNFIAGADAEYTITAENLDSFPPGTVITLEDKKSNIFQNLMQNPDYRFSGYQADDKARFFLHFTTPISIPEQGESAVPSIWSVGKTVHLSDLNPAETTTILICNLIGQELVRRQSTGVAHLALDLDFFSGYAIVKVQSRETTKSAKVFVR